MVVNPAPRSKTLCLMQSPSLRLPLSDPFRTLPPLCVLHTTTRLHFLVGPSLAQSLWSQPCPRNTLSSLACTAFSSLVQHNCPRSNSHNSIIYHTCLGVCWRPLKMPFHPISGFQLSPIPQGPICPVKLFLIFPGGSHSPVPDSFWLITPLWAAFTTSCAVLRQFMLTSLPAH